MVLVCPGCKNQITLEDASVPEGIFKVRCTGCGKIITSQRNAENQAPGPAPSGVIERKTVSGESISPAVAAFVKNEIATAKKEILDAIGNLFRGAAPGSEESEDGGISKNALICSADLATAQSLALAAKNMGYQTEMSVTAADALKNLDGFYSLVLIDPSFTDDAEGAKKIIGRINVRKATDRRQMFVVLISTSQKTLDGNAAFLNGVNLIINKADLGAMESSIRQSQKDFQQMYTVFRHLTKEKAMNPQ